MRNIYLLFTLFIFALSLLAQPAKVEVRKTPTGYKLFKDGEPFYIKGAGGHTEIKELKYLGGNAIRTWSADDAEEILDMAHKNGLMVMMGLWVQHERHGFDYNDELAVRKQLDRFTSIVEKYKDHPALLLWGIGNEVDLFYTNTKVWDAIQDIAAMIHRIDPNHPTSTVTAGLDSTEIALVKQKAPDLDIYGMNTYGDIGMVPESIKKWGWNGPYIVAEWGPNGHWEVEKTGWGAPIEQTSTEKAASYGMRFREFIQKDSAQCIGSFVFLWGQKQETTSTWYGLFTADGKPTEPLDQLYIAWRGEKPVNHAPTIHSVTLNDQKMDEGIYLKAEETYSAMVQYEELDGDKVKIRWHVFPESNAQSAGGDFENALLPVQGTIKKNKGNQTTVIAPKEEGAYRLFVFIEDNSNRIAYANIPFYVLPRTEEDPEVKKMRMKPQKLSIETAQN
jgi:hypothetical protein